MRAWTALAFCCVALGGCLGWLGQAECEAKPARLLTPWMDGDYLSTDVALPWQTVVLVDPSKAVGNLSVSAAPVPGWSSSMHNVSAELSPVPGGLHVLQATPGSGAIRLTALSRAEVEVPGDCRGTRNDSITWDLAAPMRGDSAQPGQGVHVMTAGYYQSNGTLFYTNIKEVDQDPDWPRVSWYAWEGADPLPVYVYDEDRSEQPAVWHGTTSGTPLGPVTGDLTLWDYYTTIPGFNEALKGLPTTTTRVAVLTPEQGYTRPGNEAHPLYGAALVFYVKVLEVVDVPCPRQAEPWMCAAPDPVPVRDLPAAP